MVNWFTSAFNHRSDYQKLLTVPSISLSNEEDALKGEHIKMQDAGQFKKTKCQNLHVMTMQPLFNLFMLKNIFSPLHFHYNLLS
jgi:hypothetical protein